MNTLRYVQEFQENQSSPFKLFISQSATPETNARLHMVYQSSLSQDPEETHVPLKAHLVQERFRQNPHMIYISMSRVPVPIAHAFAPDGAT